MCAQASATKATYNCLWGSGGSGRGRVPGNFPLKPRLIFPNFLYKITYAFTSPPPTNHRAGSDPPMRNIPLIAGYQLVCVGETKFFWPLPKSHLIPLSQKTFQEAQNDQRNRQTKKKKNKNGDTTTLLSLVVAPFLVLTRLDPQLNRIPQASSVREQVGSWPACIGIPTILSATKHTNTHMLHPVSFYLTFRFMARG